jgi:hypothetical protein
MNNQNETVEKYKNIYFIINERELINDEFFGWVQLNENIVKTLKYLENIELTNGVYFYSLKGCLQDDPLSLETISEKHYRDDLLFKISLSKKSNRIDCPIFEDWNDLLKDSRHIKRPLVDIFFTSTGVHLTAKSEEKKYKNYQNVHKLYELVEELIDRNEGTTDTIYFERPLSFKFTLESEDLDYHIDIDAIKRLLDKDVHKEAMNHLICTQIVKRLKDVSIDRRFAHLVQNSGMLVADVLLDYKGYVENYSFDKIRKEYLEKQTEYISKIHNVFDGIALKLLSLPAGLWFATSQINSNITSQVDFHKNLVILITVILLAALLIMNICGQFSIIKNTIEEYSDIFDALSRKFEEEENSIIDKKDNIDTAAFRVKFKLYCSIAIAVSLVLLTGWLCYLAGSEPVSYHLIITGLS